MNVLAESDFVLEIALRQPEAVHAGRILELAERGDIRLVVPAYAMAEPFHKLGRDRRRRRELRQSLDDHLSQMSRSSDFADIRVKSTEVMAALAGKSDVDKREFDAVSERILKVAEIIPMSAAQLRAGMIRQRGDLGAQDALMFAAAMEFLDMHTRESNIFVNRNPKDFLKDAVIHELAQAGCKVLVKFEDARYDIENELARSGKAR